MKTGLRILALVLVAAALFAAWQYYQRENSIIVAFADAKGLRPGAPVRMAGVDIGVVRDVTLGEQGAEATILLDREAKKRLTTNSLFVIDTSPAGGAPAMVLAKEGPSGGRPLAARARVQGMDSIALWQLGDLSTQLSHLLESRPVLDFINNLKAIEKEMDEAIRNFDNSAMQRRLESDVAKLKGEFEQVIHDNDAKEKLERIDAAITRLRAAIDRIDNSPEAKRLGQDLDDLGSRVRKELAEKK